MIKVNNLTKRFKDLLAVDDLTFRVSKGEVLGFLGPNGAGKSTTMKILTGFLAADHGCVSIGGHDLGEDPVQVKRLIGYLPEGAPLYGDMTPRSFLEFIADIRGLTGKLRKDRLESVIEDVALGQVLQKKNETLSKGFKRRVGLAQAMLHDPEVLILDEPTDGLDPNQKHEVRELIRKMSSNKVVVLSTHILEEVEAVCSRAIIISNGKLISDGTPQELEGMSLYQNAITLTVEVEDVGAIEEALQSLSGVAKVEHLTSNKPVTRFRVFPVNGQTISTEVATVLSEHRALVSQLQIERGRLDEVFRMLTTS